MRNTKKAKEKQWLFLNRNFKTAWFYLLNHRIVWLGDKRIKKTYLRNSISKQPQLIGIAIVNLLMIQNFQFKTNPNQWLLELGLLNYLSMEHHHQSKSSDSNMKLLIPKNNKMSQTYIRNRKIPKDY